LGRGVIGHIDDNIYSKNFLNFGQKKYKKSSTFFIPVLIFSLIFLITSSNADALIQIKLSDQLQVTTENSNLIQIMISDQITSDDNLDAVFIPGIGGAAFDGGGRGGGSIAISGLLLLGDLSKGIGGKILDSDLGDPETAQIFEVGEEVVLRFDMIGSRGIFGLEHATLYMNIRDDKNSIEDSDSYIRFIAFEDLIVKNDSELFSSVDFNTIKTDVARYTLEFYIIFAQPMEVSDIHLSTWNFDKRYSDQRFKNAIKIIPEKIDEESTLSLPDGADITTADLDIGLVMGWVGLSEKSVSDDELLKHMGIEGEKIPSWVKKSKIGKWLSQGLVNEEDFQKIIKFLYSEGFIV